VIAPTIPALVDTAARLHGDTEALVDGPVRLTFTELRHEVRAAAKAFIAAGVIRGDRVAIWCPNVAEWVIAALGAQTAGAAIVPLNTRFKGPEAADIIARSKSRVLLCANGFLGNDYVGMLGAAATELPDLERIVVLRGETADGAESWADFRAAGADIDDATLEAAASAVAPDDLSDIIFTSGTTGRPKGVMCTHHQTLRTFEDWSGIVGLTAGDRYLVVNPFFHTFGYKAGFLSCLLRGATIVPEAVFDVDAVLARVEAERITMLPGPPTLLLSILAHPDRARFDLSSLRLTVTGAAPVPVEMIRRMREELTFSTIITGYGLTESTGTIAMCRPDDDPATISGTSGRAIHDVEVRVVDDDGVEVPRGTPGEIVCRGYNVMQGYLDDPAATAEAIDADGWLHTGDIGTMNEAGYLTITDRKKDMFIVGGFNAYPAEIENGILAHPAVAQVAVVGVPDDRMGEVGHAYVVARAGADIDPDELIAWCRERMANYKVPRAVHVRDALPLNASGKVLKYELRAGA
jgi:HIP---CoA ligase